MKYRLFSSKYFIVTGVFIFLCFTAMIVLMKIVFNTHAGQISTNMATQIYQLKSNSIRNEFNNIVKGLDDVDNVMPQIKTAYNFQQSEQVISALLLSNSKINKGWYAIAKGPDTSYNRLGKYGYNYTRQAILNYQQDWAKEQLNVKDSVKSIGKLISRPDSLHWLVASRYQLADSSILILGLDINLKDLQRYLGNTELGRGKTAAFIIDEKGKYIISDEQSLVGKPMPDFTRKTDHRIVLPDSVSSYEMISSFYSRLPVIRFYTPLYIGSMKWTMIVDTPVLIADQDVRTVELYVVIIFVFTALLILVLIIWTQGKWRKQFAQQQVELTVQQTATVKTPDSASENRERNENSLLQLDLLKEKINPLFLFNSLGSLNKLLEDRPDMAKTYAAKLSRVYQYVLAPPAGGLSKVIDEIHFANDYFYLLRVRFGNSLAPLSFHMTEAHLAGYLPFMSIQILIENAVNNNIVSKSSPLYIAVHSEAEGVVVSNNLQLRNEVKDSEGMKYLQAAYAQPGNLKLQHGNHAGDYKYILPVIECRPGVS